MRQIDVSDIDYQDEIKKCNNMEDVVGSDGLMQKMLKSVIQQMLEGEMEDLLGREKSEK